MYGESGIEVRMLYSWAPKLFKTFIFALKKNIPVEFTKYPLQKDFVATPLNISRRTKMTK